jgi:uncharacterized protein (DUF58 family)
MPQWNPAEILAASKRVRLSVDPRRRRMGHGARLGAGAGASLEFHDHRAYVAGDDLRHLDWSVYARTEQLMLRRHRQEVSPRIEIICDLSLSMAISEQKLTLATNLTGLFATLAEYDGARPQVFVANVGYQRLSPDWRMALPHVVPAGSAGIAQQPAPPLTAGSERIIISDGLYANGVQPIVTNLGQGCGRICLVQILTHNEMQPQPCGAARLEDVEGGASDLIVDEQSCLHYRERFARHQASWQAALAGRGAGLITCVTENGLATALNQLLQHGVLEARQG